MRFYPKRTTQHLESLKSYQQQSLISSSRLLLKIYVEYRKKESFPPKILTPRVNEIFTLKEVSTSFVCQELLRLTSTKTTGLDNIPAKLLKDAAPIIAKPIAHLINRKILTEKIPFQWKEAKVIPIFKAGKRSDENNYRPTLVLPTASKIMERAVQVQLLKCLTDLNILSIYQAGF